MEWHRQPVLGSLLQRVQDTGHANVNVLVGCPQEDGREEGREVDYGLFAFSGECNFSGAKLDRATLPPNLLYDYAELLVPGCI